jgi:glycosyltransferase involved in cell wall biosynthesis
MPPRSNPAGRVAMTETSAIRTTVVIPAYRAWDTLPGVLSALAPQIRAGREAILVYSGDAPDGEFAQCWPWLRIVGTGARLLPGKARNLGAAHARGELLAFLDADTVPASDWLDRLQEGLVAGLDAMVGALLNGTPDSRIGTAEYLLTCSETFAGRARPLRHGPGANLLIRRKAFEAAGGFNEQLPAGEDTVLTFPIASLHGLGFAPGATATHRNRTRLVPFLANQRRQGAAYAAICATLPYPNGWVCHGLGLLVAGPLRLLALANVVLHNRSQARPALACLPQLLVGTAAWVLGAWHAPRRRSGS